MHAIKINIDDSDMVAIEAEARERSTTPEEIVAMKLRESLRSPVIRNYAQGTMPAYALLNMENSAVGRIIQRDATPILTAPVKETKPSRAERKAALMKMRELWHPDPANPIDGVEYQKAMRAEWG